MNGLPDPIVRVSCPLNCGWAKDMPQSAITTSAAELEEQLRQHFSTHTPEQFLAQLKQARQEKHEALELIRDFLDPDPCYYDHHGYCQAHGWCDTDPACPHARARKMLPTHMLEDD